MEVEIAKYNHCVTSAIWIWFGWLVLEWEHMFIIVIVGIRVNWLVKFRSCKHVDMKGLRWSVGGDERAKFLLDKSPWSSFFLMESTKRSQDIPVVKEVSPSTKERANLWRAYFHGYPCGRRGKFEGTSFGVHPVYLDEYQDGMPESLPKTTSRGIYHEIELLPQSEAFTNNVYCMVLPKLAKLWK